MVASHVLALKCHASFFVYGEAEEEDLSFEVGLATVEGGSALLAHHAEVVECFFGLFAVDEFGAKAEVFSSDRVFLVGVTSIFRFVGNGMEGKEFVERKRN